MTGRQQMRSEPFKVERENLSFLVHDFGRAANTVQLVVNGEVVRATSCRDTRRLIPSAWHIAEWKGQQASLVITDADPAPEGWIGIDSILFFDGLKVPTEAAR
jgi:fructan beta-fructosidase